MIKAKVLRTYYQCAECRKFVGEGELSPANVDTICPRCETPTYSFTLGKWYVHTIEEIEA